VFRANAKLSRRSQDVFLERLGLENIQEGLAVGLVSNKDRMSRSREHTGRSRCRSRLKQRPNVSVSRTYRKVSLSVSSQTETECLGLENIREGLAVALVSNRDRMSRFRITTS